MCTGFLEMQNAKLKYPLLHPEREICQPAPELTVVPLSGADNGYRCSW